MTAQKSVLFNDYQQQALAALGIPLWQSHASAADTQNPVDFCYRIDNLLILTAQRFEPQRSSYCHDLLLAITELSGQPIAAVAEVALSTSANWPSSQLIDLRSMANSADELAALKRRLWQQISHQFSA
jgi:hypothetical protein